MALSDIRIPSRPITITQAFDEAPEVTIDVFGLTTDDFVYLLEDYQEALKLIFLRNEKTSLSNPEATKEILLSFPGFAATCVACGCKQRAAKEYTESLPFPIQMELLSTVFLLTFPEGLKKSLEKLLPMILPLLKK